MVSLMRTLKLLRGNSFWFIQLLFFFQSCGKPPKTTLFSRLDPSQSGIAFNNAIEPRDSMNIVDFNYFYNGGGIAVGDINNDQLPDLFFSGNQVASRLYLNKGNLVFEDITEGSGISDNVWGTGVTMADVNGDGFLDIYLCASGYPKPMQRANKLYINNKNNTFTESAHEYGIDDTGYTTQAAFFDFDNDRDLDLFLLTVHQENDNPNIPRPIVKDGSSPSTDRLYRNNGNGTFTNVSREAGITIEGYGLGVAIIDVNEDLWPDIYVTNDFIYNDVLYVNNKDGTFSDKAAEHFKHTSQFAMGNDAADFNNDGLTDLVAVDMLPADNRGQKLMNLAMNYDYYMYSISKGMLPQYARNTLQLNNGNGSFSEIGQLAGIYKTNWSWSPLFFDADNDGWKDLFITNGIPRDIINNDFIKYRDSRTRDQYHINDLKKVLLEMIDELEELKKPNFFFRNKQDLTFSDETERWGFSEPTVSTGASYADLDLDGDLDLIVSNINEVAYVYRNESRETNGNHYLKVRLNGPKENPAGIGTKVILHSGKLTQTLEQSPVRGFQSSVEQLLHFGMGEYSFADSLTILWMSGKRQTIRNVKADQEIVVAFEDAQEDFRGTPINVEKLFTDVSDRFQLDYRHQENDFVDFKIEPMLLQKYSQRGPHIATGDVNGDGIEDFCLGGSKGNPGKLFIQQTNGQFHVSDLPDREYEDAGLLLFDCDNDNDLDLYVASGGTEFNPNTQPYAHRLYLNDGKGGFVRDVTALPEIVTSGSCVVATDYDNDGDQDLFVGGRIVPGRYPTSAHSFILNNNHGKYTNVTQLICPDLINFGMVTSALWSDFDNDNMQDLIVVGEWLPITFFRNTGGVFKKTQNPFDGVRTEGWWNRITPGDFDDDGDLDYVVGNLGVNTRYHADKSFPVSLYAKDFDGNGSIEPFVTNFLDDKEVLVHSLDAVVSQIPSWRRKFTSYESYASATFSDYFSKEDLKGAHVLKAYNLSSCFVENLGDGRFDIRPLPLLSQISTVNDIVCNDFDSDGHLDLLMVGNNYGIEFVQGQYDAFIGLFLRGDGKNNFTPVNVTESGFYADGDCRAIAHIKTSGKEGLVVVARNSQALKLFEVNKKGNVNKTIARK